MGSPRQEDWSGLPFPSPGDLPDPRFKPTSPALPADSLPLSHLGSNYTPIRINLKDLMAKNEKEYQSSV